MLSVWYRSIDNISIGCIDKSSSAELSEAINSMFRWYKGAGTCFAFLEDVTTRLDSREVQDSTPEEQLRRSRWFRRGWTLQELLAPRRVHFYSVPLDESQRHTGFGVGNTYLGSKISLKSTISKITGIDAAILEGSRALTSASIAQRMSWAANRKTSRLEDEVCRLHRFQSRVLHPSEFLTTSSAKAYCLMGLFEVNMPM